MELLTAAEVRRLVRAQIRMRGDHSALARSWGVSTGTLADVLSGRRPPGPQVLRALGLRRVVGYHYRGPAA